MGQSAAMVQAKVVKGGGAGDTLSLTCEQILSSFDPPIEFGSHAEMVGSMEGYQAEHIVPTSAMHQSGRSGARIGGCDGYSTSGALTWMVGDGQSAGFEHKILTDAMRVFSQSNSLAGQQAPLGQWLDEYQNATEDALRNGKPPRAVTREGVDRDSLIAAAAECIRARAAESFAELDPPISEDTPLRNPWEATRAQQAAASANAQGGGALQ